MVNGLPPGYSAVVGADGSITLVPPASAASAPSLGQQLGQAAAGVYSAVQNGGLQASTYAGLANAGALTAVGSAVGALAASGSAATKAVAVASAASAVASTPGISENLASGAVLAAQLAEAVVAGLGGNIPAALLIGVPAAVSACSALLAMIRTEVGSSGSISDAQIERVVSGLSHQQLISLLDESVTGGVAGTGAGGAANSAGGGSGGSAGSTVANGNGGLQPAA